jgi:hypothetical protein
MEIWCFSKSVISCQIPNYQFLLNWCRYEMDTRSVSYRRIRCQIEIRENGVWELEKGKSRLPDSPLSVDILFGNLRNFSNLICCYNSNIHYLAISWSKGNYLVKGGDRRSSQTSGVDTIIIQREKPFQYLLLSLA